MSVLLETKAVVKQFGEFRAVDRVDFRVQEGEVLALIGSNGAGKTTLVNLISGLLTADEGQILFRGQDVTTQPVKERIRAGIARSFQLVNLFDQLSALDNVALAIFSRQGKTRRLLTLADADRPVWAEATEVLSLFRLDAKARTLAGGLSPGGRQLLDVAIAHALEPPLLFLHEPPRREGAHDADRHSGARQVSKPAPMLELERIETYRGPAQILRSISLTVGAGEAVCLVGRNGAGKTTTIDTIMGLLPARSGVVRFKGQEVTRVPAHERARMGIGYAPEDCGIFPDLSVEENFQITAWIGMGRGARDPAPARRLFASFPEAKAFLTRRGLHLSGGQKKMVAITPALHPSPAVLLLPAPFLGPAP